ncbi:MAG TPA: AAA family ATPase, partial [Pyrinomonadaceae bacterium]|nr:AAA family ATPase [Pyrinomonadaceae bacterium]
MDDIPPTDPYKKQRERARAESAELDPTDTMRVTRPANEWHLSLRDRKAYSEELFGPLWRVGEVALLFGPRGVGKSTLAVQIAESIARGRPLLGTRTLLSATNAKRSKGSRRRGEKVLYVDM